MHRRNFLGASLATAVGACISPRISLASNSICPAPNPASRLNQGPFTIQQDAGWRTLTVTTPSKKHIRNYGLGLVGYTWEENGPALTVRNGSETLEHAVERMASLPFVDVLYIRCDWRDVQSKPGRLDLSPVWNLTLDAARRHGLRFAFRVMLSNPEIEPEQISMPKFLREKVPLVKIGNMQRHGHNVDFVEPRYDNPAFQSAFLELNELLAARFDNEPLMEWMDLMMYGFWGEGHTSDLKSPFPDFLTAEKTFLHMTEVQLNTWKKVPLAVNTQPDISKVGNDQVRSLAERAGCWLRSDSIVVEEPIQIDELGNRPPYLPVIMEDGGYRQYDLAHLPVDSAGVNVLQNQMLHVLDLGANYWALWTEAENLARYNERYPEGFHALQQRMGYRIRPAWIWQRKRWGTMELIVGVANDGVAGIPGWLRLTLKNADGSFQSSGTLDLGMPHAGKVRQASFLLPAGIGAANLKLSAEIETKALVRRAVQWSCEQHLNSDGSFPIQLKSADAAGWRKGV